MRQTTMSQTELKIQLASIFTSAMQANVRLVMDGITMVRNASTRDEELADTIRNSTIDAAKMWGNFFKSGIDTAVKLVDVGVTYAGGKIAQARQEQLQKTPAELTAPMAELLFSGAPGETCTAGVTIGNDKNYPVDTGFRASEFTGVD